MRQPDNLAAFCRVYRNGRPLIGIMPVIKNQITTLRRHIA